MKYLKRIILFVLILTSISLSVHFSSSITLNPEKSRSELLLPGSYLCYRLSYERILPNGDFLGIMGKANINYMNNINSTHINVILEVLVELSWITGNQDLNITQNVISKSIAFNTVNGDIINGVLYYFGNDIQFFNPIHISPEILSNKTDINVWSYSAVYYNTRTVQWNYKEINVTEYYFKDTEYSDLSINSSYHPSTGIMIYARCHFLQRDLHGLIQHILYVGLERTNIQIIGVKDISSLLIYISLSSLLLIIPLIILIIWFFKKPIIIKEGGS